MFSYNCNKTGHFHSYYYEKDIHSQYRETVGLPVNAEYLHLRCRVDHSKCTKANQDQCPMLIHNL